MFAGRCEEEVLGWAGKVCLVGGTEVGGEKRKSCGEADAYNIKRTAGCSHCAVQELAARCLAVLRSVAGHVEATGQMDRRPLDRRESESVQALIHRDEETRMIRTEGGSAQRRTDAMAASAGGRERSYKVYLRVAVATSIAGYMGRHLRCIVIHACFCRSGKMGGSGAVCSGSGSGSGSSSLLSNKTAVAA